MRPDLRRQLVNLLRKRREAEQVFKALQRPAYKKDLRAILSEVDEEFEADFGKNERLKNYVKDKIRYTAKAALDYVWLEDIENKYAHPAWDRGYVSACNTFHKFAKRFLYEKST